MCSCVSKLLVHVEFKLFNTNSVIRQATWLTPANFNVSHTLFGHSLQEPRHTSVVTALATMVTPFAIPQCVGGVPLVGW